MGIRLATVYLSIPRETLIFELRQTPIVEMLSLTGHVDAVRAEICRAIT